ncbi:MAG: hypothetical protein ACTH30_05465 [Leucobacter sp.]
MSIEIRAKVKRHNGNWSSCAYSLSTDQATGLPIANHHKFSADRSWAEAMQSAYLMLAALEQQLMDEVHASRASRRLYKAACTEFPVTKPCDCQECDDARAFVEATA